MKDVVNEPIKDAEVKPFFDKSKQTIDVDEQKSQLQEQKLFDQELESVILRDPKGAELQKLVEMGYLNLQEDVISEYIGEKGREYKNGIIVIDRDVLSKIHSKCLSSISKQLGADRDLNIKDLEQIASREDHLERIQYIEKETHSTQRKLESDKKNTNQTLNFDVKITNEKIDNVCKDLNILGKEYLNDKEIEAMLKGLGLNANIKELNQKTYNTFMSLYDSNIMVFLAKASILKNNGQVEELNKFIEASELGLAINQESKFYQEIVDGNGNIDIEKGFKFWEKFKVEREFAVLNEDIIKYVSGEKNERKLALLLLRGTLIEDKNTQEKLKTIANGLDVFDKNGNFDKEKLYRYVEKKFVISDAKKLLDRNTYINDEAALKFTERIQDNERNNEQQKRIKKHQDITDASEARAYKMIQAKKNKRICSKKEEVIYNVLNSLNAGNTSKMKDFFETPDNAKQVVLLFCQFRKKELGREITADDVNTYEDSDTSAIIAKYMMENSAYFDSYFQEIGQLKPDVIAEMANSQNVSLSANQATRVISMYDMINMDIKSIENTERKYSNNLNRINELLEIADNGNGENEIYELAKKIPISAFSTEMLEKLKNTNEEKFNEAFKNKKVERAVGRDTFGAICYSAARLFSKGIVTLPRMIIDKETREEYMPRIKNHVKSGAKRVSNALTKNKSNEDNLLGKFIKSFKGEKNKELPAAIEQENIGTNGMTTVAKGQNEDRAVQGNALAYIKVDNSNGIIEADAQKLAEERQENERTTKEFVDAGDSR